MTVRRWLRTLYEVCISDLRVLWFSIGIPMVVLIITAAVRPRAPAPQQLVWTASLLQALGILQVAAGLHSLRVELGQPSLKSIFRKWFSKALSLVWPRKPRVFTAHMSGGIFAAGSATARGLSVDRASLESRVAALETQLGWLEQDLQSKIAEVHRRVDVVSTEFQKENTNRRTETSELRQLLDRILVGGLDLEVAGLAWILIGQVVGTWPQVFAPLARQLIWWGI